MTKLPHRYELYSSKKLLEEEKKVYDEAKKDYSEVMDSFDEIENKKNPRNDIPYTRDKLGFFYREIFTHMIYAFKINNRENIEKDQDIIYTEEEWGEPKWHFIRYLIPKEKKDEGGEGIYIYEGFGHPMAIFLTNKSDDLKNSDDLLLFPKLLQDYVLATMKKNDKKGGKKIKSKRNRVVKQSRKYQRRTRNQYNTR